MKVAFDTNVLLDTILNRPGREDALRLMLAVSEEKFVGVVSANSITDMYYLARKGIGDEAAREAIFDVLSMFDVAPVDGDVCSMALNTPMSDYEDAVLAVCAVREGADYIATGDQGFLKADSPVQVRTPAQLLHLIEASESERENIGLAALTATLFSCKMRDV